MVIPHYKYMSSLTDLVDFFVLILFERLHTFHSILLRWNDENNKAEMPKFNETSWKLVSCKWCQ